MERAQERLIVLIELKLAVGSALGAKKTLVYSAAGLVGRFLRMDLT